MSVSSDDSNNEMVFWGSSYMRNCGLSMRNMGKLYLKDALLFSAWFGTPVTRNTMLVTPLF